MENIELFKKKFLSYFAKKYYSKTTEELTTSELRKCSLLSEFWAYIYSVVPDGFGDYTIFDFNGYAVNRSSNTTGNFILPEIALSAKDKVCKFCWGMSWEKIKQEKTKNDNNISRFLRGKSVMMKRSENGSNIIIYGLSEKPIGRTMLASVIIKEAIRLRVTHLVRGQTYDWIDFSKLFNTIKKETVDLVDYKSCDWLVVDNILKKPRSIKQNTLISDIMDPFFLERLKNRQSTILVFKFDIRDKSFDIERAFGMGISRIVNSKRTLKVPLCEDFSKEIHE